MITDSSLEIENFLIFKYFCKDFSYSFVEKVESILF